MIEYQIIESPVGQIVVAERVAKGCATNANANKDSLLENRKIFFLEFINGRSLDIIVDKLKRFYPNEQEVVEIGYNAINNSSNNRGKESNSLTFEELFDTNKIGWERLEIVKGTQLQKKVWETLFAVPFGTILSYSQLAQMANYPNAIRAVASAVGDNPISLIIPCHRVVRKEALNGKKKGGISYGEYLWGSDIKKSLIEWEIEVNSQVESINLKKRLFELSTPKYKKFSQSLIPTNSNYILGVRTPALRELAKEILKGDWREFLNNYPNNGGYPLYFEELMVWGMVINGAKMELDTRLQYVDLFVPYIDNWSVCDTFCAGAKWTRNNIDESWSSLQPYLVSDETYKIRYGVVMLMSHFLFPNKISDFFVALESLGERVKIYREYYVEMAIAWAIATAAAKFSDQTLSFLEKTTLPLPVLKKAAQKIRDSYRVSQEYKLVVTNLIASRS